MKFRKIVLCTLTLLLCVAGCANTPKETIVSLSVTEPNASPPPNTIPLDAYRFEVGDMMDVKFFYYPELNETVTVRPDGRISLQLVGDVQTRGLTPMELHAALTRLYTDKLRDPNLAVIVKEFTNQRVYIGGEVNTPRSVPCVGRLTALQAIMEAGGSKDSAALKNVIVLRDQGTETPEFLSVNLKEDLDAVSLKNDMVLQARDIVFVPKTEIARLDQFVDQHLKQLIPMILSFNVGYNLTPEVQVR